VAFFLIFEETHPLSTATTAPVSYGSSARVTRRSEPAPPLLVWGAIALFLGYQVATALAGSNGPFLDEGIYITAGLRTFEGHGITDGYLGWFAGSLLWPAIAGAGWFAGGLAGAKIAAGLLVTAGLTAATRATRNLYGPAAAGWGFAVCAAGAPVLALGHLAVYDVVAVAGLGMALLAITELSRTGHRGWLVAAAVSFAAAVLGKYAAAFLTPILIGLLVALRGRRARVELTLIAVVLGAILLGFFLPWRYQLAWFVQWRAQNNPAFGVTRSMIAFEQVGYTAVFVVLAVIGVVAARGSRRVAVVLAAGLFIFPAYHLLIGNSVSAIKHMVFGIVLAMPVIGRGLAAVAGRATWQRCVTALAVLGYLAHGLQQVQRLDHGWVDARPGALYLAGHMRPDDSLLVPNAWQVLPYLYGKTVSDPNAVTDAYDLLNVRQPVDLCRVDWIVNTINDNSWPAEVMDQVAACGTFAEVFRSESTMTNLGGDYRYVTYEGAFVIYENTGTAR
jgi:hypothetical protein